MTGVKTFDDYANEVFVRHILKQLETAKRVDVVWDAYIVISIKESAIEKRGKNLRRKVSGQEKSP